MDRWLVALGRGPLAREDLGTLTGARRDTFMTAETSLGKPSRVPEGHLELVPRPWWSLGACRPVLGGRLLLVAGLGELPPSCGWSASSSSLSNLSVIEPSVGEVDHAVPEYTPSAFRGGSVRKDSSGTQADSMDCCWCRVEGLHGDITRCMVRCYRDRAIYGWRLPTQGCEFLEIERGSFGAGSVA
ncbi:hypothetical protein CRG98_011331 [Punica granatum]|uniref:Uncharacterized protein n=1 Tax=Punica granatum TaxID=22663 RepID=A0A2I0KIE0_PUNGR|nr:hypothetical protein CRG98_011331 [Punica granatum]